MQIPDAELDVLAILWNGGELTTAEIRERLESRRPLTHASVSTLLRRLEERELVVSEKSNRGKAFVFRAKRPAQVRKRITKSFLDRVFDGCGVDLVTTLLKSRAYSSDELDQMQQIIESLRETPDNETE